MRSIAEKWAALKDLLADEILTDTYTDEDVDELIRAAGGDPEAIKHRSRQQAVELLSRWRDVDPPEQVQAAGTAADKDDNKGLLVPEGERSDSHFATNANGLVRKANTCSTSTAEVDQVTAVNNQLERTVCEILEKAGAIERECDYELPSGRHSDTHVNLWKICRSESVLNAIVCALDDLLLTETFDTVVSTNWAVGTIARRLVLRRNAQQSRSIRHVRVEGYTPPIVLEEVRRGANVILLVDVVVTGQQIKSVEGELWKQHASSVKAIAIVEADFAGKSFVPVDARLCRISMNIDEPNECRRCQDRKLLMVFNPIAGRMTNRKERPRSPSEFLKENPAARELWDLVNIADAVDHHRKIGKRHYVPFIDTRALLENRQTGPVVVEKLCREIEDRCGVPDVVIVPTNAKATLLGKGLINRFKKVFGQSKARLVRVRRFAGGFAPNRLEDLSKLKVLVADVVTAHGDTLDELAVLSLRAKADSVCAAVLLSRMSEGCERAFNKRLRGHFVRLYSLPIRPATVRDENQPNCYMCQSSRAIGQRKARGFAPPRPLARQRSLLLAPLMGYREKVVSAIALHALHAAKNDGMAPLALPEIVSSEYPPAMRAALVRDLPPGTIEWSGVQLRDQLVASLKRGDKALWTEVVEYMERDKSLDWATCLGDAIENSANQKEWMDGRFWKKMKTVAAKGLFGIKPEVASRTLSALEALAERYEQAPESIVLQEMLDSARAAWDGGRAKSDETP